MAQEEVQAEQGQQAQCWCWHAREAELVAQEEVEAEAVEQEVVEAEVVQTQAVQAQVLAPDHEQAEPRTHNCAAQKIPSEK